MEQVTESSQNYFTTTKEAINDYVYTRWQLLKLQATETSANVLGMLFIALAALSFLVFIVFSISMLLGYWFSYMLDSEAAGFAVLTGMYLLMILVLWLGRHAFVRMISNAGIKIIFGKKKDDGDKQVSYKK